MAKVELNFWKRDAAATAPVSAGVSGVLHVVLITAWVIATLPSLNPPDTDAEERVWYLPPPDPEPAIASSTETLRYVEIAPEGLGAGLGETVEGPGVELSALPSDGGQVGNTGVDSTSSQAQEGSEGVDTVFTVIQVDSAAARLPESAAPKYPADLLQERVEGQAIVQFVVDTSGRADAASFVVIVASHPAFAESVREALPGMRFSAARIGAVKVRQLVELPFAFHIADPAPVDSAPPPTSTKRPPF